MARASRELEPALRTLLEESLPDYMMPAAFVLIDRVPLTASGKIDRRALLDLDSNRRALATPFVAAKSEVERSIAAMWKRALQLDAVGVDDNFFELGGNSLLLYQVLAELQTSYGARAPGAIDMFELPTVAALAGYVARAGSQRAPSVGPTEEASERGNRRRALLSSERARRSRHH